MEITSVPSNSPFGQSSGKNTDFKSTPGFGNPSNASTASSFFGAPSPAFPTGFTTGTSNAFPSTTLGFGDNSNQSNASATSSTFGAPSSAFTTGTSSNAFQLTGFGINSNSFGIKSSTVDEGRLQSISGMPVYESKSHEELRLEDYELKRNSKGDGCDTPVNIFRNPNNNLFGPPIKTTTSSTNSTFVPSSLSPFPQTSPFFIKPNTTTVPSPNPFSLPKTNPNPSQPQPFVPSSTNPNPFPPFPSNGCDSPVNIFRNPFNNMFGPPIKTTNPSTNLTFVPSSSPFPQTTQSLPAFINQNTATVPSPNPFTLPKTNPNPFQPQPFVPSSANPNPFPPSPSKGCDTVVNIFRNPNNNMFGPPINSTTPSTISTVVPSSSPFSQTIPFETQPLPALPAIYKNPANYNTTTVGYPHINGQQQQYVQANTVGVQSTLVADPFPTRSEIDRSYTGITLVQHGISSLPSQVPNNLSANRSTTSLRIRHVSQRLNSLPHQQRYTTTTPSSSEHKVPFFENGVDRPGPFLPRENPRAWVTNSLPSHHSSSDGKCWEEKEFPSSSPELNTCIQEEAEHLTAISISHQNDDDDSGIVAKKHEDDVLALMPQLPNGDEYYTDPSLTELAAKEMDKPGSLSRVNDFVVGKCGYGSIKFLGETDVRHLDLATIVQFKNREVIVYADEKTKPVVGEGMNKKAEVTLLNVKCVGKTGKQYVDGPRVESYKEMLKKKGLEQGTEFVSYDPVRGEWRFRVQHF